MSDMILCVGVISLRQKNGDHQNELFTGWAPSIDAARGAWFKQARDQNPGAVVTGEVVADITDTAENRPA